MRHLNKTIKIVKILIIPSLGEDVEELEFSYTQTEWKMVETTLKNSFEVS